MQNRPFTYLRAHPLPIPSLLLSLVLNNRFLRVERESHSALFVEEFLSPLYKSSGLPLVRREKTLEVEGH